jgi:hypothetical protein
MLSVKHQLHFLIGGFLSLSLNACKSDMDQSASRIKTLDSIASGTLNLDAYQCKGSNQVSLADDKIIFDKTDGKNISDSRKSELRKAVKDYFSSLPESTESLFLKFGGQVLITAKASDICSSSHYGRNLDEAKGEKTDGCFHFVNDPTGKQSAIFTIVHSPDARKIRYYGPQIFGYLYAQFYSRLTIANNQKSLAISEQEPMQLITLKEKVANAFLADILATKDYKIDVLENLLGINSDEELKNTAIVSPLERLTSLKDRKKRAQFLDYVYANSFQSAHCNNASREVARNKFKRSAALFVEIDSAVNQVSAALNGKSVSTQQATGSASSFSLAEGGLSLGGGDLLSSIMPLFGNLLGMSGGGGSGGGGVADLFTSLLGGGLGGNGNAFQQGGGSNIGNMATALFSQLSASGCEGGGCSGCQGGCSGGCCSSCSNGSCGGSCGSCSAGAWG